MVVSAVYEQIPESEGGGYTAYAEEGDTLEDARENLRDAIELLMEAYRELVRKPHSGQKVTREKITVSVA